MSALHLQMFGCERWPTSTSPKCFVSPTSSPPAAGYPSSTGARQRGGHTKKHNTIWHDWIWSPGDEFKKTKKHFMWWSLTHRWLWLTRQNVIFLFSKHWLELKRRVTQLHTSWNSRGREEFMSHWWSQAVSYSSRAWKSNCDRFSWKNANLRDPRRDLFWSAAFGLLIPRDPIWCESRHGGCLDWFKTLFWRCVVSCHADKSVIVCCLTVFQMMYWLLMQVIV